MVDRYESDREPSVAQHELSVLSAPDPLTPPEALSALVPNQAPDEAPSRFDADGCRVPGKQNGTVRRRVRELYERHHWLQPGDVPALTRYAIMMQRFLKKAAAAEKAPPVREDRGDLAERRVDAGLRADSAELSKLEAALGLTARSRVELGVGIARGLDLAEELQVLRERHT